MIETRRLTAAQRRLGDYVEALDGIAKVTWAISTREGRLYMRWITNWFGKLVARNEAESIDHFNQLFREDLEFTSAAAKQLGMSEADTDAFINNFVKPQHEESMRRLGYPPPYWVTSSRDSLA